MKLHFLSPKKWLLYAVLFVYGTILSTENVSFSITETTSNQYFKVIKTADLAYLDTKDESIPFRSVSVANSSLSFDKSTRPTTPKLISTGDNSYKNTLSIITASNIIAAPLYGFSLFENGVYYGFALMVVLLNLICYFLFEEKIFLFYSLALTSLTLLFFNSDGLFALVGFTLYSHNPISEATLLTLAIVCNAIFSTKFLLLDKSMPNLSWLTALLVFAAISLTFCTWLTGNDIYATMANAVSVTILALYFIAGIIAFSKTNYAKFYVIASSIPFLFALDYYGLGNLNVNFLFTESIHLKIAVMVEMVIITYAILFRMREIKTKQDIATSEIKVFLAKDDDSEFGNTMDLTKFLEDTYLENVIMQYDLDGLEIKLLQYISEGKTNLKIAKKLNLNEEQLEDSIAELYFKLEIGDRVTLDEALIQSQPDFIYN